jgi:hypothetical protein
LVPEIYEADGKTWQASNAGLKPMDFDPWVRSVKWTSKEKGKEGETKEVGLKTVCFEYWWASSHYVSATIRRSSLSDYEASFANSYRVAKWSTRQLNGLTWRVAEVPTDLLQVRPPNGLGGPYRAWLTELGDTGYVISIEMGASQESLDQGRALDTLTLGCWPGPRSITPTRVTDKSQETDLMPAQVWNTVQPCRTPARGRHGIPHSLLP